VYHYTTIDHNGCVRQKYVSSDSDTDEIGRRSVRGAVIDVVSRRNCMACASYDYAGRRDTRLPAVEAGANSGSGRQY
jgi:hypothetical protein